MLKYTKTLSPFLSLLALATPSCQGAESEAKNIQIFVVVERTTLTLKVQEGRETIREIKKKIEEKIGLLTRSCLLFFQGKELEDNETLADRNIQEKSTLHRVMRTGDGFPMGFQTKSGVIRFRTSLQYYESGKYKNKTLKFFKDEKGIPLDNKISFDKNTKLFYSNPSIDFEKCILDGYDKNWGKNLTSSPIDDIPSSAEILSDDYNLTKLLIDNDQKDIGSIDIEESTSNEEEKYPAEETRSQIQADIPSNAGGLSDNCYLPKRLDDDDKKEIGFIVKNRGILFFLFLGCLGFLGFVGYKAFKIRIKRMKQRKQRKRNS